MPNTFTYAFDPNGSAVANKIIGEQQILTVLNYRDYHFFVPKFAPFFTTNLSLQFTDKSNVTRTLVEGQDYVLTHMFLAATRACGKPVYGSISLVDTTLEGVVTLSYQTIGGEWTLSTDQINALLSTALANPRITAWDAVVNLPSTFPVVDHQWDLVDLVGLSAVVAELIKINESLLIKSGNAALATYTQSQVDALLANKLNKTGTATLSLNSNSFDGRSFDEAMTEILTGTAWNSDHFAGMNIDQFKSFLVTAASDSTTLNGMSLTEILNSTVANSLALGGKSLDEVLSLAHAQAVSAGSSFAGQITYPGRSEVVDYTQGWTQVATIALANSTTPDSAATAFVSVGNDQASKPGLYAVTVGYNLTGAEKYDLSVINVNRNVSPLSFCYSVIQSNGVDAYVYVYARTATNRPAMSITTMSTVLALRADDTFQLDEPFAAVYVPEKTFAYSDELEVVVDELVVVNNTLLSLGATTTNHSGRIATLESKATADETNIATLTTGLSAANTNISTNSDGITSLGTRMTTAEGKITANKTSADTSIANLQTDVSSLKTSRTADEANIAGNTASIASINSTLTTMQSTDTSLQSQITSLSSTVSTGSGSTSTTLTAINADITSLKNSRTTDETNIATLQSTATSYGGRLTAIETDTTSLKASRTTDEANIAALQTTVGSQGTSIGNISTSIGPLGSLTTAAKDTVVNSINSLKSALDSNVSSTNTVSTNLGTTNTNLTNVTTRVSTAESNIVNLQNAASTYQPKDSDLTAIAGLGDGSTGLLRKIGTNTWTLDTSTFLTGITSSMVITALGFTPFSTAGGAIVGNVTITGTLAVSGLISSPTDIQVTSDEQLKTNWHQVDDEEHFIANLATVLAGVYDRLDIDLPNQLGVGAQSLEQVLPQAVGQTEDGFKAVRYGNAALYSAVKLAQGFVKQEAIIAQQNERLANLEMRLLALEEKA